MNENLFLIGCNIIVWTINTAIVLYHFGVL
jgi:hypothetical protein